jgi:hypothetical protein
MTHAYTRATFLFFQARAELTEELQEVVRMAFERRRQLHLAALAAGRVQSSATPYQHASAAGSGGVEAMFADSDEYVFPRGGIGLHDLDSLATSRSGALSGRL